VYARSLQPFIEELLAEFRVVYLTGARQSGKTTLVREVAERMGMGYVTLDDQATLASVGSDPHGFIRSLGSRRVVLDEFQYSPNLIPAIANWQGGHSTSSTIFWREIFSLNLLRSKVASNLPA